MKKILLFLILITIVGCTNIDKKSKDSENLKKYVGIYTYGFESEIFRDEKTGINYWLSGNVDELNDALQEIIINENIPYPSVRIKIMGVDQGEEENEFVLPGDRRLEVVEYKIIDY